MSGLDLFALFVLLTLIASAVALWLMLAMWPGKVARSRQHPQQEAIAIAGWWGAITLGILSPLAFIWAYTSPGHSLAGTPVSGEDQAQ